MESSPFSRRTMLRGAGGAALALPALEITRGSRDVSAADPRPKRFVICHCGMSVGGCYNIKDGPWDLVTPRATGARYEQTLGLKAIFDEGVQTDMGLVSGLYIPVAPRPELGQMPSDFPRAGTSGFHGATHSPQYAGKTVYGWEGEAGVAHPNDPSCDQLLVPTIYASVPDPYMKTLPLRLEAWYGDVGEYGFLSWEADPNGKTDRAGRPLARGITPMIQPSGIWRKLFDPTATSNLGPPTSPEALEIRKRHKRSVLDAVQQRVKQHLLPRLGQHDLRQVQRWSDHIRTLETQIEKTTLASCVAPPSPADPPSGREYQVAFNPDLGGNQEVWDLDSGWGSETDRARIHADLIHHAFMCDRTRVVSWLMTGSQTTINMVPITGFHDKMHAITHTANGIPDQMAKAVSWHIAPVARLVKLLQGTTDFDGSRMIDNTVIMMIFEGGWGHPQEQFPDKDGAYARGLRFAHSSENMIVITAGGKNLGLLGLIRFRRRPTKGGYDGKDGEWHEAAAGTS